MKIKWIVPLVSIIAAGVVALATTVPGSVNGGSGDASHLSTSHRPVIDADISGLLPAETFAQEIPHLTDPDQSAAVVLGRVTGKTGVAQVDDRVWTDYSFSVQRVFGANQFGYSPGDVITVRNLAGAAPQPGLTAATIEDDAVPQISVGDRYYIWVAGGTTNANATFGGATTSRVVTYTAGRDVWEVHGDEVTGQGPAAGVKMAVVEFEKLLHAHDKS